MGFEPTISASERPQIYALDRAATGTGYLNIVIPNGRLNGNVVSSVLVYNVTHTNGVKHANIHRGLVKKEKKIWTSDTPWTNGLKG